MRSKLIVNADDFGLCKSVNKAVWIAHNEGILMSATVMANMPGGDEAVAMAKEMPDLGVGVHLNLVEGRPISRDRRVEVLIDRHGEFFLSPRMLAIKCLVSEKVRNAIKIEMSAQIEWAMNKGICPTHLDSHMHVHSFPAIYPIVVSLAERFQIIAIRWPFEAVQVGRVPWPGPSVGGKSRARIVRAMAKINRIQDARFIVNDCFLGLAHTGRIDGHFWRMVAENPPMGVTEVMTHPAFVDETDATCSGMFEQGQVELDALCDEEVKKCFADTNVELVNFGNL